MVEEKFKDKKPLESPSMNVYFLVKNHKILNIKLKTYVTGTIGNRDDVEEEKEPCVSEFLILPLPYFFSHQMTLLSSSFSPYQNPLLSHVRVGRGTWKAGEVPLICSFICEHDKIFC